MIPLDVPCRFRRSALYPEPDNEDWPVWSLAEAIELINALGPTKIVIDEVQAYELTPTGLVPTGRHWAMHATPGDTASDRAVKSRGAAAAFIRGFDEEETGYVGIRFSSQDQAA